MQTHKTICGIALAATEVISAPIAVAGARIPKKPELWWRGFGLNMGRGNFNSSPYTSISRRLGQKLGHEEIGRAFGRSKIVHAVKGAFVVAVLVEAGISIKCGLDCSN